MASTIVDMTQGLYRKIYGGFVNGQRINSVSMEAEAWFWRVLVTCDDFGNRRAEPILLRDAAGTRDLSLATIEALTAELVKAGLIGLYEANGEKYLHVYGFEERQPAGKNGKRIRRHPECPGCIRVNPGESSSIPVNPVPSSRTIPMTITSPMTTPTPSPSGVRVGEPDHRIPNSLLYREVLCHYPRQEAIRGAYEAANDAAYRLAHSKHGGNVEAALGFLGQRVREYAKAKTGSEARYIPMARKWFEDGRYNDDPATWVGEAKPKTAAEMIDEAEEKERKRKAAKGLV